jgi:protocatechuate 3,4-dioxygenase, alpha subunit
MSSDPATSSATVGPFFHFALTVDPALGHVVAPDTPGERIQFRVSVSDGDDAPVTDAMVEIWQTVPDGFGRLATNGEGWCDFETIRPGTATDGSGAVRASHVNICLFARGLLRQLHTRAYFEDDAAIAHDAALALVPTERRETLLARRDVTAPDRWVFEVRLQGDRETVFFDL